MAAGGALVFVNTIVYVRDHLHRAAADVPFALGAYGAGSMTAALLLPRALDRARERTVMLPAGWAITGLLCGPLALLSATGRGAWQWPLLLAGWAALGAAGAVINAPAGRLIRRCTTPEQRADAFAAQFSLSHSCWLLTYPLAGWLGARSGLLAADLALGALALIGTVGAVRVWPAGAGQDEPSATGPVRSADFGTARASASITRRTSASVVRQLLNAARSAGTPDGPWASGTPPPPPPGPVRPAARRWGPRRA